MSSKYNLLMGAAVVTLAFGPAIAVRAADSNTIGEVVVTATKTGATNLQKTPISISVVGGDLPTSPVSSPCGICRQLCPT